MKKMLDYKFILPGCLLVLFFLVFEFSPKPDLEITSIDELGPARINAHGEIELPIRIVVKNIGEAAASGFNIDAEYMVPQGTFQARFIFSGLSIDEPLLSSSILGLGRKIHVLGKAIFPQDHYGVTAILNARVADSKPDESFTDNNESWPIQVILRETHIASSGIKSGMEGLKD